MTPISPSTFSNHGTIIDCQRYCSRNIRRKQSCYSYIVVSKMMFKMDTQRLGIGRGACHAETHRSLDIVSILDTPLYATMYLKHFSYTNEFNYMQAYEPYYLDMPFNFINILRYVDNDE